jgi:hypothetical protein
MRLTFVSIILIERLVDIESIIKTEFKDNVFFQLSLALKILEKKFNFCESSETVLHRNVGYKYGDFFKFYLVDHLKAICGIRQPFNCKRFIFWSRKQLLTALQLYLSQKLGMFLYNGSPTKDTVN